MLICSLQRFNSLREAALCAPVVELVDALDSKSSFERSASSSLARGTTTSAVVTIRLCLSGAIG